MSMFVILEDIPVLNSIIFFLMYFKKSLNDHISDRTIKYICTFSRKTAIDDPDIIE